MNKDKIRFLDTKIDFSRVEPLKNNPMVSKVKIKIAEPGRNRNGSIIRKSVLLKGARQTLGMAPIVGYYSDNNKDFGEHGVQVDGIDKYDGSANIVRTQAFGAIPEKPEVFWEDGFLTTYGYVWTERFPFLYDALKNGKGHSMELDPKRLVVGDRTPDGYYDFEEIAFKGLCILGDKVPPAFTNSNIELEGSRAEFSDVSNTSQDLKDLFFSLGDNKGPDFLVENLTREQLEAYVNRITNTINELDKVADESESEDNIAIIDSIISKLVAIEKELQGEPKLTPISEDAVEALKGEVQDKDGIVSTSYKKEENISMTEEEKRKLQEARDSKAKETEDRPVEDNTEESTEKPVEPQETPIKGEDENGRTENETPEREEPEEKELPGSETEDKGREVPVNKKSKRQGASVKRAEANLADTATEDVLAVLINRIGKADEAKQMLMEAFDIDITENADVLPENAQPETLDEVEPEIIEGEAPQTSSEVSDGVDKGQTPASNENTDISDDTEETQESEENLNNDTAKTEKEITEDPELKNAEGEGQQEIPETPSEDEKDKKKNFALQELADGAEMLLAKNSELQKRIKELENFKANVELEEKEEALSNFSISDEEKEKIRSNFNSLSVENVMEKAAFALYRTNTEEGQKDENADIEFSLPVEEVLGVGDKFNGILKAMREIKEQ